MVAAIRHWAEHHVFRVRQRRVRCLDCLESDVLHNAFEVLAWNAFTWSKSVIAVCDESKVGLNTFKLEDCKKSDDKL
jgi:hypothetical protein